MADQNPQTSQTTPASQNPQTTSAASGSGGKSSGGFDPAKIQEVETRYTIPDLVKQKYPDLIGLVLQTESMNDDERDYWFQILPIMTEEQIAKFHGILVNERNQLARLDKEYEDQMKKLNDKHQNEWTEFEAKKKREIIQKAESQAEQQEKQTEEDLLKKLEEN